MSGMLCEISTEKICFVGTDHKLVKHIRNDFSFGLTLLLFYLKNL